MKGPAVLLFLLITLGCISTVPDPDLDGSEPAKVFHSPLLPTQTQPSARLALSDIAIDGCNLISGSLSNPGNVMHENISVHIRYGDGRNATTNYFLSIGPGENVSWTLPLVYSENCYEHIMVGVESVQDSYERKYPAPHCPDSCANGGECSAATGWVCVDLEQDPLPYYIIVSIDNEFGDDLFITSLVLEDALNVSQSYSTISEHLLSIGSTKEIGLTASGQFYVPKGESRDFMLRMNYEFYFDRDDKRVTADKFEIGRYTTRVNFTLEK